jgi:hypothetical protein
MAATEFELLAFLDFDADTVEWLAKLGNIAKTFALVTMVASQQPDEPAEVDCFVAAVLKIAPQATFPPVNRVYNSSPAQQV